MCYDADMFCACSLALLCILDCRRLFLYVVYGLCVTVLIVQDSFIILTNDPFKNAPYIKNSKLNLPKIIAFHL